MSIITCLIIFSGSSARSIMSFRFARINVLTLSKSPMTFSFQTAGNYRCQNGIRISRLQPVDGVPARDQNPPNANAESADAGALAHKRGCTPPYARPYKPPLQENAE